jgi:predicted nucleic acid-binding protein
VVQQAIALRQQVKMGLADAVIAATALAHNLPLATRNVDDFKHITGLQIINPFTDSRP